jgi:hypothetical protein
MSLRLSEQEVADLLKQRGKEFPGCSAIPEYTRKSKYNSQIAEVDNIKFRSKKEAKYYQVLKARVHLKEVSYFLRQVPIHLPGNTKYVVDFIEFWTNGTVHFIDVKGKRTPAYIRSKKQVEALYPIFIEEM